MSGTRSLCTCRCTSRAEFGSHDLTIDWGDLSVALDGGADKLLVSAEGFESSRGR
jgi:hypothetical protein